MNHVYVLGCAFFACTVRTDILMIVNFRYFENECPDIRKVNKTSLNRNFEKF